MTDPRLQQARSESLIKDFYNLRSKIARFDYCCTVRFELYHPRPGHLFELSIIVLN